MDVIFYTKVDLWESTAAEKQNNNKDFNDDSDNEIKSNGLNYSSKGRVLISEDVVLATFATTAFIQI